MSRFHRNATRRKPTRIKRRELMAEYGIETGRQWNRLRKGLQRARRKAVRDRQALLNRKATR